MKKSVKFFAILFLLAAVLGGTAYGVANATVKQINATYYADMSIIVDGREVEFKDASGNKVEPFVYNGTTYVPLRGVSNALTQGLKPVNWDSATHTITIGDPLLSGKVYPMNELTPYQTSNLWSKDNPPKITVRNETMEVANLYNRYSYTTYLLDSRYESMQGKLVCPDSSNEETFWVKANGIEIFRQTTKKTEKPVDFKIDLFGVDKLEICGGWAFNVTITEATIIK